MLLLDQWEYLQENHFCSLQSSPLGKTVNGFYPPTAQKAPSSTTKPQQGECFPISSHMISPYPVNQTVCCLLPYSGSIMSQQETKHNNKSLHCLGRESSGTPLATSFLQQCDPQQAAHALADGFLRPCAHRHHQIDSICPRKRRKRLKRHEVG